MVSPRHYEPSMFNVGFEIVNILPDDVFIYRRVFEKCGEYTSGVEINKGDYLGNDFPVTRINPKRAYKSARFLLYNSTHAT